MIDQRIGFPIANANTVFALFAPCAFCSVAIIITSAVLSYSDFDHTASMLRSQSETKLRL